MPNAQAEALKDKCGTKLASMKNMEISRNMATIEKFIEIFFALLKSSKTPRFLWNRYRTCLEDLKNFRFFNTLHQI